MKRSIRSLGRGLILMMGLPGCAPTASAPAVPCGSPPPSGYCCAILWGSLHGSVMDNRGAPQAGVAVTLRTRSGAPLGNCAQQQTVLTDDSGRYAFDTVPFDTPLEVVSSSATLGSKTLTTSVVRGPMVLLDITY